LFERRLLCHTSARFGKKRKKGLQTQPLHGRRWRGVF
jgi:hypothetical protein